MNPEDTQERLQGNPDCSCQGSGIVCLISAPQEPFICDKCFVTRSTATQLAEALERLLDATDSLLPTEGPSEARRMSERVSSVMGAEPEEWATAAHYWIEAHAALTHYRGERHDP